MDTKRENLIVNLTEEFAVNVIEFQVKVKKMGVQSMAHQLFRSATSIGANVMEAQNAESIKDFIHKMKVAAKEGGETQYWLRLCERSSKLPSPGPLWNEIITINKILNKIVATSKQKQQLADRKRVDQRLSAN